MPQNRAIGKTLLLGLLWGLSLAALCVNLTGTAAPAEGTVAWSRTLPATEAWFLAALALVVALLALRVLAARGLVLALGSAAVVLAVLRTHRDCGKLHVFSCTPFDAGAQALSQRMESHVALHAPRELYQAAREAGVTVDSGELNAYLLTCLRRRPRGHLGTFDLSRIALAFAKAHGVSSGLSGDTAAHPADDRPL